ncbi:MAG TPA: pentapeptide repeat-containing protein [Actinophytocola sp.]|uniref:pentapeptide repeat-containing protein n=1 Tax=Actinophytocola sp. TaxID=1872138 RepID=UPI002E00F3C7|nr:pentapeptide repeat-containing protein [Actinophytocola sp.]
MSTEDEETVRYGVLSPIAIWTAAAVILLVGVGVAVWLLIAYGGGDAQQRNQLEAIRTAGTIVVGTGGAAALLLAARRQRTAEIALKQKDREHAQQLAAARATEHDATQRRITELYAMAAGQLGSDMAAVRLAGLYALERLAQAEETQRQTIVSVICAYLCMPFTLPSSPTSVEVEDKQRQRELQVRLAAQRLLIEHLRFDTEDSAKYWTNIDLDLTGAKLIDFSLSHCRLGAGFLSSATFIGKTTFASSVFTGEARFVGARFTNWADFRNTRFAGDVQFDRARFDGLLNFRDAQLGSARFVSAMFAEPVDFHGVAFTHGPGTLGAAGLMQDAMARIDDGPIRTEWPPGWAPLTTIDPQPMEGLPGLWQPLRYMPSDA